MEAESPSTSKDAERKKPSEELALKEVVKTIIILLYL
jgi:hypothetical protein